MLLLKPGAEVVGQAAATLLTMFIGKTSGVIGETSVICLLIGAIYLVVRKIISLRIPTFLHWNICSAYIPFRTRTSVSMLCICLQEICGGGLILGAFFMATDYVTSPITPNGKISIWCLLRFTYIHIQNVWWFSRRRFICNYLL